MWIAGVYLYKAAGLLRLLLFIETLANMALSFTGYGGVEKWLSLVYLAYLSHWLLVLVWQGH
jgi:hypothetical protein